MSEEPNENETELKPCPFCGGKAEIMVDDEEFYIQCKGMPTENCPSNCGLIEIFYPKEEAIAAWNRRAPHPTEARLEKLLALVRQDKECKNCHIKTGSKCNGIPWGRPSTCPDSSIRPDCPIDAILRGENQQ